MKFSDIIIEDVAEQAEIAEANPGAKILPDAKMSKMLALAVRHDHTIPRTALARLGPKATDQEIVQLWSNLIDQSLSNTMYGNLAEDGRFDGWLTKLYINQVNDFEDINGEGADTLGKWKMLSVRSQLLPADQDFNKFRSIEALQAAMRKTKYQEILEKIRDEEKLEQMKRDKKEIVLIDSPRFYVMVPLNYGSCYFFNNHEGIQAGYCTGSSSQHWFGTYSSEGPIVSVIDKRNADQVDGKWQFHAPTNQLVDAHQNRRGDVQWNDERFADLFPGLMRQIVNSMEQHAEELKTASAQLGIAPGGWNIAEEVDDIKATYPQSYNSEIPEIGKDPKQRHKIAP
jgi:hypothetical protein